MSLKASLRRKAFEPVFFKKSGSPRLAYWRELERTQFFSREQLEEIQWNRLRKLWKFLWRNNSFYRKRFQCFGLNEKTLQTPDDIRRLPILTKKEIREHGRKIFSDGFSADNLLHFKTGGSTGKALDIFITEECSELRNACARRHDRWSGWEPGEPIGAVWGNPKLPKKFRDKIVNSLIQPYIYLDTMSVSEQSVNLFVKEWERKKPTLLFGHAHSLYILARKIDELKVDTIKPTGIISTSMMLMPHERVFVERVFSCKVTDRYGCEEVSLIGSECERHNGLHMNIEHLVIEFIRDDGTPAAPDEPGKIVVTDLMNYAMPFVRYRVEDIGMQLSHDCACGRGLPLMGPVIGRVADFLVNREGGQVAGVSLIENTLTKYPALDQMQIIQNSYDDFCLNIVPGKEYSEETGKMLIEYFRKIFGHKAQVAINLVNEIEPEVSGKYRFSICNLPGERY